VKECANLQQLYLADRTYVPLRRTVSLMLQCCVCHFCLSVRNVIVAKRCVHRAKLLLTAMRNRLVPKWMTLTFI